MGRKIPAKKHRGVKNPLEQQARREKSLKSKINAPPKDPDEQPVPRSLTRLFAFQDKSNKIIKAVNKKKRPSNKSDQKLNKGKNPVSELKRLAGESGRSFSLRINGAMRALHGTYVYPQDMEAEDVKGERMAEQRARRQRKRRPPPPSPSPAPPPQAQAHADRAKAAEAAKERAEVRYERVEFGDVAHAPPALHTRPRPRPRPRHADGASASAPTPAPRPGRRALLLTPLLAGDAPGGDAPGRRRELARRDAVAAYRALNARALNARARARSSN